MKLIIPDMSCGHCAASITRALHGLDPQAKITFDMPARRADLATSATPAEIVATLERIGFPASLA